MKKNFEELYENLVNNTSGDYSIAWEKAKKEKKLVTFLSIILAIIADIIIIFKLKSFFYTDIILFVIIFILMMDFVIYFLLFLIFSKHQKNFKLAFKTNIIGKLLNNFYDKTIYMPQKQMPSAFYKKAKYREYYNRYYSEDYMEGYITKKYPIKMAEVKTIHETTHTDSDGHTHTDRTTIFHGLFAKILTAKSINSTLLIRTNGNIPSKTKLEMDSQEFEKLFDVSATNQIIGMQLLTHDIMELLISFRKNTGIKYDISIYNNVIYLRFHTAEVFELKSLKKGAFDKELLQKYYSILDFTYTLSTMLIDLINVTEI